ncbi:MAG: hypothetical protein J6T31_07540 [Methanobrevibacter sp.]|nr:hypothetical protein [Methanobrevibacter sp.]
MIGSRPKFMDSPYFVDELFNWHLKKGAPDDVVKEFNEYMAQIDKDDAEPEKPVRKSMSEKINEMLNNS